MRDYVLVSVNGQRHEARGEQVFLPVAEYLRRELGLVGTKVVCAEGDCGACSVLVGRPGNGRLRYRVLDSCIHFMFQVDGCHLVTVEGLKPHGQLSPVQEAMVQCHASQCGYCTPGFAVTLTGLMVNGDPVDSHDRRDLSQALTGNLCRCTGYQQILDAAQAALETGSAGGLNHLHSGSDLTAELDRCTGTAVEIALAHGIERRYLFSPTDLASALDFLAQHPEAVISAGASDLGVQINKGLLEPSLILDLARVDEIGGVERVPQDAPRGGTFVLGAGSRWCDIAALSREALPELYRLLEVFGAPQIRNVATIGGNIANASPIADSLPWLFVMEAELDLESAGGRRRTVNINDFYLGYKKTVLRRGELISRIRVRLPNADEVLRLYKVSRRRDLDIASFTAAILLRLDGATVARARVALGGVAPTVIRAPRAESWLAGRELSEASMRRAGQLAADEISPISDVRGSREFRTQLTRNVMIKFYHDTVQGLGNAA